MYRLVCISGKASARSSILKEGENTIGRLDSSDIRISSSGVSKKHAMIIVRGDSVYITDLGSKNGTFVNGIMVKRKDLNPDDKIAIHDHIFQLVTGVEVKTGELHGIPGVDLQKEPDFEYKGKPRLKPAGFRGHLDSFFETAIMPFFETLMRRYPVSVIITVIFVSVIIVVTLIVTIPVVKFDQIILDKEASQRGIYLAHLLAQYNKDTIGVESAESPSIKAIEDVPGVTVALITDVTGRILAPSERVGEHLPGTAMARIKRIIDGDIKHYKDVVETEADVYSISEGRYLITTPIKGYSEEEDKTTYIGFALVDFSTKAIKQSLAGAWERILVGMVIAAFIGLLVAMFFSKLFSLPFLRIYDEVDLAMKGEVKRVSFTFGSKYGEDFVELINILLRKSRRASAKSIQGMPEYLGAGLQITDEVHVFDSVGRALKSPFFVLDTSNSIVSANSAFSSVATYKTGDWHGVPIVDAIREQRLLGVILSLISRFETMGQDLSEEILINDKVHRISISGTKNDRGEINYYCIGIEMV